MMIAVCSDMRQKLSLSLSLSYMDEPYLNRQDIILDNEEKLLLENRKKKETLIKDTFWLA